MSLSDSLKKLKRLFGAESSEGLQERLASLRLAVEKGEETIRSLRAGLQAVKEELRATKQELAAEKAARQVAESAPADERGASATLKKAVRKLSPELHRAQARLGTDGTSSSKPPSSDFPKKEKSGSDAKPDPKSLRKRSGLKPGARKGHRGTGFPLPEGPPDKIACCLPSQCRGCVLADRCAGRGKAAGTRYAVDCVVEVEKAVCQATARECPLRSRETLGIR